jgi:glutathione S-transferase
VNSLILWSYDASPFTQKAVGLLALKGVHWSWVETPMLPPKDDLMELTGGYRGTPVLQIGADIYVDSQLIARELEQRFAEPTLFPQGRGYELAMVKWSDAFFRSALRIALALMLPQWPAEFRNDRQYLFPDINFDTVGEDLDHARAQFRAHASLLEQQLADGRAFLGGAKAGLSDIQAYPFLWLSHGAFAEVAAELLQGFPKLGAWEERMRAVYVDRREAVTAAEALACAAQAESVAVAQVDAHDAQQLVLGQTVEVIPDDTRRGGVQGQVLVATADHIAIERKSARLGRTVLHFPRLGYRVTPTA